MTDPRSADSTTPRRRRKPSAYPVVAGSLAAFMGLFGFMAYELRAGHDPALGNPAAAAAPTPTRVVQKRIEHRIIVTKLIPSEESDDDGGGSRVAIVPSTAPVQAAPSAPVVSSAPAQPAPAQAPVVTRSS